MNEHYTDELIGKISEIAYHYFVWQKVIHGGGFLSKAKIERPDLSDDEKKLNEAVLSFIKDSGAQNVMQMLLFNEIAEKMPGGCQSVHSIWQRYKGVNV